MGQTWGLLNSDHEIFPQIRVHNPKTLQSGDALWFSCDKTDDGKISGYKRQSKRSAWIMHGYTTLFNSYTCFSISTKYTSSHNAQGSKLMATNSLLVAILSFLEIDDLPNGFEVLKDHHSVKR